MSSDILWRPTRRRLHGGRHEISGCLDTQETSSGTSSEREGRLGGHGHPSLGAGNAEQRRAQPEHEENVYSGNPGHPPLRSTCLVDEISSKAQIGDL